jgi:hypothetical protein
VVSGRKTYQNQKTPGKIQDLVEVEVDLKKMANLLTPVGVLME